VRARSCCEGDRAPYWPSPRAGDRSAKAIALAKAASRTEIASGVLSYRHEAVEEYESDPGELPFDIAFAVRVGGLDGRHANAEARVKRWIAAALTPRGRLFIHGGDPLREIPLDR
jgi:hypothetical protein